MKYIISIIQPDRLDDVLEELELVGVHLVTVTQVMGRGRQKGIAEVYRSHVESGSLLHKVKIETAVNDDFVPSVLAAISKGARTGHVGDGKIFVMDLEQTLRIRTGEEGPDAIG